MMLQDAVKWVDAIELHCLGRSDVSISEIIASAGGATWAPHNQIRAIDFIAKQLRLMQFERYRVKDRTWRWRRPADRTGVPE